MLSKQITTHLLPPLNHAHQTAVWELSCISGFISLSGVVIMEETAGFPELGLLCKIMTPSL